MQQNTKRILFFDPGKSGKDHKASFFILRLPVFIILLFSGSLLTNAQDTWTLTRCVDYALANNIDLTLKNNQVKTQQINLSESKADLLPDLNMGSSVNMNFGRNIDPNTNAITFNQTMGNGYWISSSINIFQGMVKRNSVRFNHYLLSASREEALVLRNKLIFQLLTSYYTVLYSYGLVDVAKNQAALSKTQIEHMQKFVKVGQKSPLIVQEFKSQWATDKLSLVRAQNTLSKTLLELKQLLRLDAGHAFAIDTSITTSFLIAPETNVDSIYHEAIKRLPEIKQKQYLYNASRKDLTIAKGYISPRVYLSTGYGTNYFNGAQMSFSKQIINNQNQWITMGLSIPVFNHASIHSQIKRKTIALDNRKLELEKQQEALYSEIWNAVDELKSAEKEYQSSLELYKLSKLTLKNISVKLDKGLASATDYEIAKQRYISSKATLLKARLIYIMHKQMLEFYRTGNWNHLYR